MRRFYKLIIFSCFLILSYSGYGQKDILFNERVKGQVLDTIEFFANSVVIHTLWLNDTIQVDVQNKTLKFDSKKEIKIRSNS